RLLVAQAGGAGVLLELVVQPGEGRGAGVELLDHLLQRGPGGGRLRPDLRLDVPALALVRRDDGRLDGLLRLGERPLLAVDGGLDAARRELLLVPVEVGDAGRERVSAGRRDAERLEQVAERRRLKLVRAALQLARLG